MSETKVAEEQKRKTYTVDVKPMEFDPDCSSRFISSNDFCKLANMYFKACFDDVYGTEFEVTQGMPTINLYFNHVTDRKEGAVYGCVQAAEQSIGNTLIEKTRNRDNYLKNGDKYFLTEDAKDIIKPILTPARYNQGNPQWKSIVADIEDRNAQQMFMVGQPGKFTKVVGISPEKLCGLIFGTREGENFIEYGLAVLEDRSMRQMPFPGAANKNYVIQITKAYNGNLRKTCERFGIANIGSNIVCG